MRYKYKNDLVKRIHFISMTPIFCWIVMNQGRKFSKAQGKFWLKTVKSTLRNLLLFLSLKIWCNNSDWKTTVGETKNVKCEIQNVKSKSDTHQ